jgi:hypothetical protein
MKNVTTLLLALILSATLSAQTITNVNPNAGTQGTYGLNVQISGAGTNFSQGSNTYVYFTQGTATYLSGYGTTVNNASSLTTYLDIPFSAGTGLYDLTVINGGNTTSLASAFTVLLGQVPQITYVDTNYSSTCNTLDVTISGLGTNFQSGTNTSVWFTQGSSTIYANFVNILNSLSLTANVTVPCNQPFGFYDVNVYDSNDGVLSLPYGFFVSDTTVDIASVSGDTTVYNFGDSVTIIITGQGTHFAAQGDTNLVWLGQVHRSMVPNVFSVRTQVISNTQIRATFLFNSQTPPGFYDVFVFNHSDGELTKVRAVNHLTNGIDGINADQIKVYPNPASGKLYVESTNHVVMKSVSLTSLTGAVVLSRAATGNGKEVIDLQSIDAGVYILSVTDQTGAVSYKKIMVD